MTEITEVGWIRIDGDGGNGFCYGVDRSLFIETALYDGPLLIALDTVILIDLAEQGSAVMDRRIGSLQADNELAANLDALGELLDLWLMRDIRFIPLRRSFTDFKHGATPERPARGAAAAAPQLTAAMVPGAADRDLIVGVFQMGADVFLTRDKQLLAPNPLIDSLNVVSPRQLMDSLNRLVVTHLSVGHLTQRNVGDDQLASGDF